MMGWITIIIRVREDQTITREVEHALQQVEVFGPHPPRTILVCGATDVC